MHRVTLFSIEHLLSGKPSQLKSQEANLFTALEKLRIVVMLTRGFALF